MKSRFPRIAIPLFLCFILSGAQGSPLSTLHSFSVFPQGAQPEAALIQASDGNFYGTTVDGGTNGGNGTIFRLTPGGAISTLHTFSGGNDGAHPRGTLAQGTDGSLYGTCYEGGADGLGTVFKMSTSGKFATLYSFTGGSDSADPAAGLVQASDGNFYGTASGSSDYGAVFRITPNGTFTTVYSFTGGGDGAYPYCALVQCTDGNLYGTCSGGGDASGDGTIFQVSTNGTFNTLYTFTGGNDGSGPDAGLIQGIDGNLYGTATYGGNTSGDGTIFQVSTNGTFTMLWNFTDSSDGANPNAGLIQAANGTLYGTASYGGNDAFGGSGGLGTLFNITTNGATFTTVHEFTGGSDGANSYAGLILGKSGSLFGTTAYGMNNDAGTIFTVTPTGLYATLTGFSGMVDGAYPSADLARGKDGKLYGTAENGGANGNGAVFAATLSGTVTTLHSFGTVTDSVSGALLDGTFPESNPVQGNDGNIYGTTEESGADGYGTVFKVSTNGTFTTLYSFTGNGDGGYPEAGLIQATDGNFYGTCSGGGGSGAGTVFQISSNGTFTIIYSFSGGSDGGYPYCTLVQGPDGNLYGTCNGGGNSDAYGDTFGTIFQLSTNANSTLNTLYRFTDGSDGANPDAGLIRAADGNLYGTAAYGGNSDAYGDTFGTVFQVSTNGTFTTLWDFTDGSDGANPEGGLIQGTDGKLYGTTADGGNTNGAGTVFQITTNGTFTTLWDFTGGNDGANPDDGLVAGSNDTFYGLAENGGAGGLGTLFLLNLAPALQQPSVAGRTITLSLSTVAGLEYQVQFTTNLVQSVWANLGAPIVATNQTIQIQDSTGSGPRRFYRAALVP